MEKYDGYPKISEVYLYKLRTEIDSILPGARFINVTSNSSRIEVRVQGFDKCNDLKLVGGIIDESAEKTESFFIIEVKKTGEIVSPKILVEPSKMNIRIL